MVILDSGDIWLKPGEIYPIYCSGCQWLFQPGEKDLEIICCPQCRRDIITQNAPELSIIVCAQQPSKATKNWRKRS